MIILTHVSGAHVQEFLLHVHLGIAELPVQFPLMPSVWVSLSVSLGIIGTSLKH